MTETRPHNADPAEIAKFEAMAQRWWDPEGEFRPLHDLNPVRLDYIEARAGLAGRRVLDVGCGGGLLAEAMARRGAQVTALDLAPAALEVARLHALESGLEIDYRLTAAEQLAAEAPGAFDVVTCLEMLEHVPDPAVTVAALARLVRPGGHVICSTIDRGPRSFMLGIVAAEYVLRLVPPGTHEYARFIRPSELARFGRDAGLELADLTGMSYDPFARRARLGSDTSVNYLVHFTRPGEPAA
jgi:2-polyprenyl-6-hydroxyphenyl methylase / 3-demethylubiquinone-9 3-methyltransferase